LLGDLAVVLFLRLSFFEQLFCGKLFFRLRLHPRFNAIETAENLVAGDFVEFISDRNGKLSCKKALELKPISAIAARDIGEGEILSFDTNGDTEDLTTPPKATLRP
jgi:hypothetical protein